MLKHFNTPWQKVPIVAIDTETTGTRPGSDRAVQVGIVRFEHGKVVGSFCSLVFPGRSIPAEATAIHGITDEMVKDAPVIGAVFEREDVKVLLGDAQPLAFNAEFDRQMVPLFAEPWEWPWLDPLGLVRYADRFERGKGRHRLEATCKRHGIELTQAHTAEADARAAGLLFYKLGAEQLTGPRLTTLGQVLCAQRIEEAKEFLRFNEWRAKQPPLESASNG